MGTCRKNRGANPKADANPPARASTKCSFRQSVAVRTEVCSNSPRSVWTSRIFQRIRGVCSTNRTSSHRSVSSRRTYRKTAADCKAILAYLDENFHKKITLDDLAERFYINKFYLARLFRERYGSSVINYLLYLRISRAKELLRFTEMTVEEVGARCGMPDANYFSRAFRKIEGMSPSEFRKLW